MAAFIKVGPPEFDGFQGPLAIDRWIKAIQNTFFLLGTPDELHVPFTAHRLTTGALTWWETIRYTHDVRTMTWDVFERLFKENYFNANHRQAIAEEYETLYQGFMTVTECYNRFMELAQYARAGAGYASTLIAKFKKRL